MTEWDWVESEERINSNNLFLFFHTTWAYTSTFKFWMNLFLKVLQLSLAADLRWLGAPSHKEAGYNPMMRMIPVLVGVFLHFVGRFIKERGSMLLVERLRFTFTPNGKREFVPRDQVFHLFFIYWLLLLHKNE